jgi:hypothetical protein
MTVQDNRETEPSSVFDNLVCLGVALLLILSLQTERVQAQYSGHNLLGDFGLMAGSQAPKGRYAGVFFPYYRTGTVKGSQGQGIETQSTLDVFVLMPFAAWVTDVEILGGSYGGLVAIPFVDLGLELPRFDLEKGNFGLADIYVQPFNLGWHTEQADFLISYAFTAPVGEYEADANDNLGLGMWSHEFGFGTSVFLDQAHSWHASAMGFYEIHTGKRDLDIDVGDIFTLEGGFGKTFSRGTSIGLSGYAQWKVTDDEGTDIPVLLRGRKNRIFGLGPELVVLQGGLTIRYFVEFGGRTIFEGNNLLIALALPF